MKKVFYFASLVVLVVIAASCDKAKTPASATTTSDSLSVRTSSSTTIDSMTVKPK